MSTSSYLVAWVWYLGAVLVLVFVWWHWTRKLPSTVRNLIRVLPAALALMPWTVEQEHARIAPAWLVAVFEGFLRDGENGWRAGIAVLIAVIISVLLVTVVWWRQRQSQSGVGISESEEQAE